MRLFRHFQPQRTGVAEENRQGSQTGAAAVAVFAIFKQRRPDIEKVASLKLRNDQDSLVIVRTYDHPATILFFWRNEDSDRQTTVNSLKTLCRGSRLQMVDICLDSDTLDWRRTIDGDSVKWGHYKAIGGVVDKTIVDLNVKGSPYFIVADSTGTQIYRGTQFDKLRDVLNKKKSNNTDVYQDQRSRRARHRRPDDKDRSVGGTRIRILHCRTPRHRRKGELPTHPLCREDVRHRVSAPQGGGQHVARRREKEGSAYDLPLAIAVLAADEKVTADRLERFMLMGELSLDGSLQPIKGVLPMAIKAREHGLDGIIVPKANVMEAAVVNNLNVYGADNILEVIGFFNNTYDLQPTVVDTREMFRRQVDHFDFDFSEVKGQEIVKRAFEVACAGGHNILLIGSPGSGKSMMAKRLPSILPPLTLQEALETTKIHSVAGKLKQGSMLMTQRPFRSPHHTISPVALVGGGSYPTPGEISLAHNGILFLDEFPEFSRQVLEVMRQPLEDRHITISRAKYTVDYPAGFMLVASMNPCPCGYYNHPTKQCICAPGAVQHYLNRISGPLLDRIDLQVEVAPVEFDDISSTAPAESSAAIRERVIRAREIQTRRYEGIKGVHCNAQMTTALMHQYAQPDAAGLEKLKDAMTRFNMSARAYDRILRVARTIADLEGSDRVLTYHIQEAIGYRNLDRGNWAERRMF